MNIKFTAALTILTVARSACGQTAAVSDREATRVDSLLERMTLEQKIDYIGGAGFGIRGIPELGLPALQMSDGPFGVRSNAKFPAPVYAAGIGLAASWNADLAQEVGAAIGRDARARGVHFMLGPGVNLYRSPINGRNYEYFGEDPCLAAATTVGYIRGMQAQGVSATVKHYLGNNSEFLRHDSDSRIDERTMREIYLPAFEAAVKQAHVGAVMNSYNLVNGEHATQNGYLNTTILRQEWGFDGVLMSDWMSTYDGIAAARSGLDLEMPSGAFMNQQTLLPAIQDGRLTSTMIDDKIRHILHPAVRFGWLDRSQIDSKFSTYSAANHQLALKTARESIVLLKNKDSLLPLDRTKVKSILVVGPDAHPAQPVGGGSGAAVPFSSVSLLEGISGLVGSDTTVYYERALATMAVLAAETDFVTAPTDGQPGMKLEIFPNADLGGAPVSTEIARHINVSGKSWGDIFSQDPTDAAAMAAASKPVSRRWTGYYMANEAGRYELAVQGVMEGNACRIYVDGNLQVDQWPHATAMHESTALDFAAGPHKVVVENYHAGPLGGSLRVAIAKQSRLVSATARKLAALADVVVVAVGFDNDSEAEGADRSFALPIGQDELIREMAAQNKRTIVAVTAGGTVDTRGWLEQIPAYLHLWYPGEKGGTALAEILYGTVNPSGRLPVTFEKTPEDNPAHANYYPLPGTKRIDYAESVFVGYRGYEKNKTAPQFPFGYGLSYTTFNFDDLAIRAVGSAEAPRFEVTFTITNTGSRAGAAVGQVYVGEEAPTLPRPAKELKGFAKVELQPGEKKAATVALDLRAFAYFDVAAHAWRANAGKYRVLVGSSSANIELRGNIRLEQMLTAKP